METPDYKPKKGSFLLSEPFLTDQNFRRAVVLLTEHNDDGSIGFVLNQPTKIRLNDVLEDFPQIDCHLYIGGPVQQETLHFIHTVEDLKSESIPIAGGIYWGGDFDRLKALVRENKVHGGQVRFFLGYSGWAPKQLEEEMNLKSWILSPPSKKFAFTPDPDQLWKDILQSMGKKHKLISNYPENPALN